MMRSRRERGREGGGGGEGRVSLDDTAAADSRDPRAGGGGEGRGREPLWELLRMEWDGRLGRETTAFLRTARVGG